MKALVYEGNKVLTIKDVADPPENEGEVLIKIESVGICGSDMHAYLGHDERRQPPLILGHEAAGSVYENNVLSRRVTINPLVVCQQCNNCFGGRSNLCVNRQIISMQPREGAFAQWLSMPERNLITIPDDISFTHAALAEPIACGWHGVRLATASSKKPLVNCHCLILGGGAIGVGAAVVLAAQGSKSISIIEPNVNRHAAINRAGDFEVQTSADKIDNGCIDIVIDAVGIEKSRQAACQKVCSGGVIVHIGLGDNNNGLDVRDMTLREITFIGVYTYTEQDFAETANAIFNKQLGTLDWLEERPLSQGHQAFEDILNGRVNAAKIILKPFN